MAEGWGKRVEGSGAMRIIWHMRSDTTNDSMHDTGAAC